METIEQTRVEKTPRPVIITALRKRDGNICQFPGCSEVLDFSANEGPTEVTIDHWMPQVWGRENNWSYEQIWDLSNLKLMTKKCNAKKGDRIPNEDGTLPEKVTRTFRYRRQKRATRRELCTICDNGHNLLVGEICASCGGDAQRFPREAKAKASECDHAILWCAWCSIGVIPRMGATEMIMFGGEGGEQ